MAERLAPRRLLGHNATFLQRELFLSFFSKHMESADVGIQQDMKVLVQTLSLSKLLEEPSLLDPLLATEGWQTLMAFTRESSRELEYFEAMGILMEYVAAARPSGSVPDISVPHMDEDIPQELFDQIAAEETASAQTGSSGLGSIKVCPYCTFENPSDRVDCEVCGLPL